MYEIEFSAGALKELHGLRAFDRKLIVEAIEKRLSHQPTVVTKNRKELETLVPSFEAVPPVWELRISKYRVFYDVDEEAKMVSVRAIREKPAHQTTEEIA